MANVSGWVGPNAGSASNASATARAIRQSLVMARQRVEHLRDDKAAAQRFQVRRTERRVGLPRLCDRAGDRQSLVMAPQPMEHLRDEKAAAQRKRVRWAERRAGLGCSRHGASDRQSLVIPPSRVATPGIDATLRRCQRALP